MTRYACRPAIDGQASEARGEQLVEDENIILLMMQLGYDYCRSGELHRYFGVTRAEMRDFLTAHPRMEIVFMRGQVIHKVLDRYRAMTSGDTEQLKALGCAMLGQERPAKARGSSRRQHADRSTDLEASDDCRAAEWIGSLPKTDNGPQPDFTDEIQSSPQGSEPEVRRGPVPLSHLIRRMK